MQLKHMSRQVIRKHLIDVDPHTHLFGRIPQLPLPSALKEYLLYNISLGTDDLGIIKSFEDEGESEGEPELD